MVVVTHLRRVHIGMSRWKENWLGGQIRPVGQGGLVVAEIVLDTFLTMRGCSKYFLSSSPAEGWTEASGLESSEVSVQPVRASPAGVRLAASRREERLVGRGEEMGRIGACGGEEGRRLGRASWEVSGKAVVCRGFSRLRRRGWEDQG